MIKKQIIFIKLTSENIIAIEPKEIEGFIEYNSKKLSLNENYFNFGYITIREKIYQVLNLEKALDYKKIDKSKFKKLILLKDSNISFIVNDILEFKYIDTVNKFNIKTKLKYIESFTTYNNNKVPIVSLFKIIGK